jgi:hypothetical protein
MDDLSLTGKVNPTLFGPNNPLCPAEGTKIPNTMKISSFISELQSLLLTVSGENSAKS